jgi:quinol monooxygenase YgiN
MNSRIRYQKGEKEGFEKVVKEMSDLVRLSELGTRKYEWFIEDKGSKLYRS